MSRLYPNLEDKFRNEGVCPICMQEMELTPKFSCVNNHILCHRCKPYYYCCPKCRSPINIEIAPPDVNPFNPPPPVHLMPHPMPGANAPYPTQMPMPMTMPMPMPSAPMQDDFHARERQGWRPEPPTEDQELIPCSYSEFGCWVKFPEHLREIHESRCQFRNVGVNQTGDEVHFSDCKYKEAGCILQLPAWQKVSHEEDCPYKGRFEEMEKLRSSIAHVSLDRSCSEDESCHDPNEMVNCRFRDHGCMVRMPYHRKRLHEEKCNHRKEDDEDSDESYHDPNEMVNCRFRDHGCMVRMPFHRKRVHEEKCNHREEEDDCEESYEYYEDPDEQVDCKWAKYGCKVRPKLCRREIHEEKCNYMRDECSYKDYGCPANFHSSQRFVHERSCHYSS